MFRMRSDLQDLRKKEIVTDLSKFMDKKIRVKFVGGRECTGILKGYDQYSNLVLDSTLEYSRDPDGESRGLECEAHSLGLVIARGTSIILVCPMEGMEQIPNPFMNATDE
ncbi:hypothetical protein ACOME3_005604 [Neoechinorhynchus agilis]